MSNRNSAPDALLLLGSHCPWCPGVLEALQHLQAEGMISALETVNVEEQPEFAAGLGVRSVPWIRIGPFELEGNRSLPELREWAGKSSSKTGLADWLDELISTGKLDKVQRHLPDNPALMDALFLLFENPDTKLNTRIGISAAMESLAGAPLLKQQFERLSRLLDHPEPAVRGDACYFLSLTGVPGTKKLIRPLLDDPDENVRELAADVLKELA